MFKLLFLPLTLLSLSACATPRTVLQTQTVQIAVSEALRAPCAPPVGLVSERDPDASMTNADAWHYAYNACARRHDDLIAATAPE